MRTTSEQLLRQQDQIDLLARRVAALEHSLLLLAKHVGAIGWNYELQKALDEVRDGVRDAHPE